MSVLTTLQQCMAINIKGLNRSELPCMHFKIFLFVECGIHMSGIQCSLLKTGTLQVFFHRVS